MIQGAGLPLAGSIQGPPNAGEKFGCASWLQDFKGFSGSRSSKKLIGALLALSGLSTTMAAFAHAEVLTARQDSAGQVHVSLRGEFVWCDPELGGFRTEPEATVAPGQISILSISYGSACAPPPPPPWVPPPPVPYRLDMNLGVLPEGSYDVSWRIQDGDFAPQFILRTTTIQVGAPVLIPLPLGSGVWGSALLLFGVGLCALRRRGGWA